MNQIEFEWQFKWKDKYRKSDYKRMIAYNKKGVCEPSAENQKQWISHLRKKDKKLAWLCSIHISKHILQTKWIVSKQSKAKKDAAKQCKFIQMSHK